MNNDVKVYVVPRNNRGTYVLRYSDPNNPRKIREKNTGIKIGGKAELKKAEIAAVELQEALKRFEKVVPQRLRWDTFRNSYQKNHLPSLAKKSQLKAVLVLDRAEQELSPVLMSDLNTTTINTFVTRLRDAELTESTIESYVRTVRAALSWAHKNDMIQVLPKWPTIKRAKSTDGRTPLRGRSLTLEEVERMCDQAHKMFGTLDGRKWAHLIKGLYLSGLRLSEALALSWESGTGVTANVCQLDDGDDVIDIVQLRIDSESQKNNRDQMLPLAYDFSEFLLETPANDRIGYVFTVPGMRRNQRDVRSDWVGKVISKLGKRANVRVSANGKSIKYASAHDLRRSFGTRWALEVGEFQLMELMRHASVETTKRYYVDRRAMGVAAATRQALKAKKQRERRRAKAR